MSSDKEKLFDRERKIKSKLVNTRKIIQNKFRKAYKNRVERERDLNEKYRPITNAIGKLAEKHEERIFDVSDEISHENSSDGESTQSDHFMDFDDLTEYEDIDPHIGKTGKIGRMRSEDESTRDAKRARMGRKHKIRDPRLQKKLAELEKVRRIRAQSKSMIKGAKSAKRRRGSDDEGEAYLSELDEDGDILIQSTGQGKKSCLNKSDMDRLADQARKKNNQKILQMRKVDRVRQESKEKSSIDAVGISSEDDSDDSSVIFVGESDRHPSEKRKAVSTYQQNKFIRQMPISLQRKYKALKYPGTKNVPKPIASSLSVLRPIRQSATPASSIPSLPAIDNPFLSAEDIVQRTLYPPESYTLQPIEPKKLRKKKKVVNDKKKEGGKIELDFIPYNEAIAYEFYDDPNELCDRLRLLIASRAAGNSNHGQEINSIVSELRELGIVI